MSQAQRITKDRTTRDGGTSHVLARIEREHPDIWQLREWLWELGDTPLTERTNFWHGADTTLRNAITGMEVAA